MDAGIRFLEIAGGFCWLYFILIIIYVGPRISFHYIWAAFGICMHGFDWMIRRGIWSSLSNTVRRAVIMLFIAALVLLLLMEIKIFSKMRVYPEEPVQYVIVLGACIRGTRVTRSLSYRLKKAAAYAEKYPDCMLVVSGGQGPGEDVSEAHAMCDYLQKLGISKNRILLEDQSVNTHQNLVFSKKVILNYEKQKAAAEPVMKGGWEKNLAIAVCSNNFHMYRAMALAAAAGQWKVNGLAARTDPFMWLSFTIREGAALLKEILSGNI